VRVADNGFPPRSATQQFAVTVNEVNRRPVLAPIRQQAVAVGATLIVTNLATDPDLPANGLVFSLSPGAPAGAAIDGVTGRLIWTVPADAESDTNTVTVRVTDDGTPPLTAEITFGVAIEVPLRIESVIVSGQKLTLTWRASPGQAYQVQYKADLRKAIWNTVPFTVTATNRHASFDDLLGAGPQKYYRVVQRP